MPAVGQSDASARGGRRGCPSPQRWPSSGDAAEGAAGRGGARDARQPTGTDDSTSGDAAACNFGAAGDGSHDRLRTPSLVAAHDGLDQATAHFLLHQTFLARAAEEEEAREEEEEEVLEDAVVEMEGWLLE